jgi:hypothetical protein
MARLAPVDADTAARDVADAQAWLDDDTPFFTTINTIVADRETHHAGDLQPADQ